MLQDERFLQRGKQRQSTQGVFLARQEHFFVAQVDPAVQLQHLDDFAGDENLRCFCFLVFSSGVVATLFSSDEDSIFIAAVAAVAVGCGESLRLLLGSIKKIHRRTFLEEFRGSVEQNYW